MGGTPINSECEQEDEPKNEDDLNKEDDPKNYIDGYCVTFSEMVNFRLDGGGTSNFTKGKE